MPLQLDLLVLVLCCQLDPPERFRDEFLDFLCSIDDEA
jgi:hypothetical protein